MPWDFGIFEVCGRGTPGPYKSESSLITCEAELHGSVTRMVYSILSLIGTCNSSCEETISEEKEFIPPERFLCLVSLAKAGNEANDDM